MKIFNQTIPVKNTAHFPSAQSGKVTVASHDEATVTLDNGNVYTFHRYVNGNSYATHSSGIAVYGEKRKRGFWGDVPQSSPEYVSSFRFPGSDEKLIALANMLDGVSND